MTFENLKEEFYIYIKDKGYVSNEKIRTFLIKI